MLYFSYYLLCYLRFFSLLLLTSDTERNALKWEEYPILAEVIIESINGGKAYGEGYTIIMNNRLSPLRVGDVVQIKKVCDGGKVNYDGYSLKS